MGGMPGRSTGFSFADSDEEISGIPGGFSSFGGGGGGIPRQPRAPGAHTSAHTSTSLQPSEITKPLKVKLEDIATGTTKKLKVTRRLLSGEQLEKTLEIKISPGFKAGTKFRFPGEGNEREGAEPQDLVFVLEEAPHERFTRDGNDLVTKQKISLLEALTGSGGRRQIEVLDGRKASVNIPASVVKPGAETRVPGYGFPIRKDGQAKQNGDLVVKWDVVFPERLTASQKDGLKKILI